MKRKRESRLATIHRTAIEPEMQRVADRVSYYIHDASDVGRDQMTLDMLTAAADARKAMQDEFERWMERFFTERLPVMAQATAIELVRHGGEHPLQRRSGRVRRIESRPAGGEMPPDLKDALGLEPFLCEKQDSYTVLRSISLKQQRKWSAYFRQFGCLLCSSKTEPHSSNGMCSRCRLRVLARLKKAEWMCDPQGEPMPLLAEDDPENPALPPAVEETKPRRCDGCGQSFHPMTDGVWESVQASHCLSKRHKRVLAKQKEGEP